MSVHVLCVTHTWNTYFVADFGTKGMFDPEELSDNAEKLVHIVLAALALLSRFFTGCPCLQCKLQRVFHLECRIMQIVFGVVQDLTSILLAHLICIGASI